MAVPGSPEKAVFFVGILAAGEDELIRAADALEAAYGRAVLGSPVWAFEHTDYYREELGNRPVRAFLAFPGLFPTGDIGRRKQRTNEMERELASGSRRARPVNLDPGYLTLAKVVLASAKNYAHRIHLHDGIYAEVTLQYRAGRLQALPWTFPDFASARYHGFFTPSAVICAKRTRDCGPRPPPRLMRPVCRGRRQEDTPMARECEAKIQVESLEPYRQRLVAAGAVDEGEFLERNWVFDHPDGRLRRDGILLRLRNTGGVGGVLTVKHKAESGAFKTREEVESMVDSTDDMLRQLDILGYGITWIYEKIRATWLLHDCIFALDECPEIGCFIEIEGDPERIRKTAVLVGLDPQAHIDDSYLGIWEKYLASRNEPRRNMVFPQQVAAARTKATRLFPWTGTAEENGPSS